MLALVAIAGLTAFLLADWLTMSTGDADARHFAYERSTRRALASVGLALPGTPDLANFQARLDAFGAKLGAPVLIRIFKHAFELEVWLARDGRFEHFATYPICRWSGRLGPKHKTGDHQAPEGFYAVTREALNPNSRWYRSFNLGFPNAYDLAHGRTGSFLMVHGGCGSVGCYAMTDAQMDEIWRLVTAAFDGGQRHIQVQAYPFRMTNERLQNYAGNPALPFWRDLKTGHDLFEQTRLPPQAGVCRGRYTFAAGGGVATAGPPAAGRCLEAAAKN